MERDFCIVIHTVRIQNTVSLYSSFPDNYRNRESFYHVIIPSAQWSWRWVYWFHLVRPSPHYSPCCSPRYGWDAENWECGNILRVISALWLKCGDNAEISPYSCPNTPIRIFSAFPPHFFPYRNAEKYAEISPRSCPNTPIRIFSAFPPHFFPHFLPYKNAEISPRSCPNTPIRIFSARKMRRSGVRDDSTTTHTETRQGTDHAARLYHPIAIRRSGNKPRTHRHQ